MKTHKRLLAINLALLLALALLLVPALAVDIPDGVEPVFSWNGGYPNHKSFTPEESGYYHVVLHSEQTETPNDMAFYGPDDSAVQTNWGGDRDATFYLTAGIPYICVSFDHGYYGGANVNIYHSDADGNILAEAAPADVIPDNGTAYASTQNVLVDGSPVEFQCYALKDENGNDTNYVKLRDVAQVLNDTAVQFQVGWNNAINIERGKAYTSNGTEMSTPFNGDRPYERSTAPTNIDGKPSTLTAILLKDDAGNGYTYYKLRDLGEALGFKVDWSKEKGIFIETK